MVRFNLPALERPQSASYIFFIIVLSGRRQLAIRTFSLDSVFTFMIGLCLPGERGKEKNKKQANLALPVAEMISRNIGTRPRSGKWCTLILLYAPRSHGDLRGGHLPVVGHGQLVPDTSNIIIARHTMTRLRRVLGGCKSGSSLVLFSGSD
jgi:hypothetical protein